MRRQSTKHLDSSRITMVSEFENIPIISEHWDYNGDLDEAGRPHGLGKCIWPDGSFYEGEWKEGKKDGFGVLSRKSGYYYKGYWR
mmetsp:Transcript_19622/g.14338  ORF Transcript_19622/g.14338 Transcript_19622/m.14338 type:complete len:85 (+) Transcript_19622:293-547(+)